MNMWNLINRGHLVTEIFKILKEEKKIISEENVLKVQYRSTLVGFIRKIDKCVNYKKYIYQETNRLPGVYDMGDCDKWVELLLFLLQFIRWHFRGNLSKNLKNWHDKIAISTCSVLPQLYHFAPTALEFVFKHEHAQRTCLIIKYFHGIFIICKP